MIFENTVIVKSPSDLQNIDSGKNYIIDGDIDMGSQQIEIPESGISIGGLNAGRDTSILRSSEDNYSLFVSPPTGYSGNVVMDSLTIDLTGTNSQVFELDNDGNSSALDITNVNFGRSPSTTLIMGELLNYRQLLMDNIGFLFINDGLTFSGAWTGIRLTTSIAIAFPASATLLKEGSGFTVTNVLSDMNFLSVDSTSVFCDFVSADIINDAGFRLDEFRTSASNALPNLPNTDVKANFSNCLGVMNTYVGGSYTVSTGATTSIPSANTPVKMAGTTTYKGLTWFSGDNDNEFVYLSDQPIDVEVTATVGLDGGSGDNINVIIRQWDDSAGSYIDIGQTPSGSTVIFGNPINVVVLADTTLDQNDRIEIWVENTSDATDIDTLVGGDVRVSERPS